VRSIVAKSALGLRRKKREAMSRSQPNGSGSDLAALKGVAVLVVEDVWHVAKALKAVLEQLGMSVIGPTSTTVEARRLIEAYNPRVAIVDVNLKREMACELIDELCAQKTRVIIVSGYATPPILAQSAMVFLQKPFSGKELVTAVRADVDSLE
jgi:DNA-binding response OmpR family regulator